MTGEQWKQAVLRDFPWTGDTPDLVDEGAAVVDQLNEASAELGRFNIRDDLDAYCKAATSHGQLARKHVAISRKLGILPVAEKRERRLQRWRAEHPGRA